MDLKKYMVLSFATLWTLVLITALVTTIIHQVYYQGSTEQILFEHKVRELSYSLEEANKTIIEQKNTIELLKCVLPEVSLNYYSCE